MSKVIGLILVLLGIYFLGQNIIFTTRIFRYWYQDISAVGSVIAFLSGLISLTFFRRQLGSLGWVLVIIGIALVFLSGRVMLLPTSLWYLFISFASMFAGLSLIRTGRINF